MRIYSKNGMYPGALPDTIFLSDGRSRTDKNTFTEEEIRDAGYVEVELPPAVEYPNQIEWNSTNLEWISRSPNQTETDQRRYEIQEQCKKFLAESDYKVTKAIEASLINETSLKEELDLAFIEYRQKLRDLYNGIDKIDPWNVRFPSILPGIAETSNVA